MAEPQNPTVLEHMLKPFYQRASEAEDRLRRLEATLASKKDFSDSGAEGHSSLISELQEQNKKLAAENAKHKYRIQHLIQAVRDADAKLERN